MEERSRPTTFVLVHSAWLGGWAWEKLARFLEERGHNVFAPDLPAHGGDRTPRKKQASSPGSWSPWTAARR